MRVKELIEELSKCDPDAVVNPGFRPIWSVEQMEFFYDGVCAEVKDGKWIYNTENRKVILHLWNKFEFIDGRFRKEDRHGKYIIPKFEDIKKDILKLPEYKEYLILLKKSMKK